MASIIEGQTATNPTTGEKIVYRGGKWMAADQSRAGSLSPQERVSVKEAQESARVALETLPDVNRFESVNQRTPTGGFNRWNDTLQSIYDPKMQQLNEISARLTPAQRQPGSGTTSDRDLALFQQAVPSRKNAATTNSAIIERARAEAVRRQQYADFLDEYAAKNGTLNGAEKAFRAVVGLGTRDIPFDAQAAGDRSQLPRGAYYRDPEGNLRRNDNGARGNPIVSRPGANAPKMTGKAATGGTWKVIP